MLTYTKTPTGEQYNTICLKLIEKYPKLRDGIGFVSKCMLSGHSSGWISYYSLQGSWKMKLRDRFKFLRRPAGAQAEIISGDPPRKRHKKSLWLESSTIDDTVIDKSLETSLAELKIECSKKKKGRCMGTIQDLTLSTFSARRKWIKRKTTPCWWSHR